LASNSQRAALHLERRTASRAKWEAGTVPGGEDPVSGTVDKAASEMALSSLALSSFKQQLLGKLVNQI